MSESKKRYRSILKSSSLIGGASAINILIGMVRTKFVAVLLGTDGVGLMGMYTTIVGFVSTVVEMGISSSGVRQVAETYGCGDQDKLSLTVVTLRRAVWVTGGLGVLLMVLFCVPLSRYSFENTAHAVPIAILGSTILLGNIAVGQRCVIQGTRRISDLAKISILGSLNSTVLGVPLYWWFGVNGIVPSLVLVSAISLLTSWWYARRIQIKHIVVPWRKSIEESRHLLRLGVALMGAAIVTSATAYVIRLILIRVVGLSGVGIYQSAYNLSGILVSFVLGAMGADYYPRLTMVSADNAKVFSVMNDQTEVAILLALPGLVIMFVFAPILINMFYAPQFMQAVEPLWWFSLGVLGRVLSWPLGIIMLAKAYGMLFFVTEFTTMSCLCMLSYFCIKAFGVVGAGMAFCAAQFMYLIAVGIMSRRMIGGLWRKEVVALVAVSVCTLIALLVNAYVTKPQWLRWCFDLACLGFCCILCAKRLMAKSGVTPREVYGMVLDKLQRKPC